MITGKKECSCPGRELLDVFKGRVVKRRFVPTVVKRGRNYVCKACGSRALRKKFMTEEGTSAC